MAIEDRSAAEGFSRRVAEAGADALELALPRWSPDGARFVFMSYSAAGNKLMLSNTSGGPIVPLDPDASHLSTDRPNWSPDGQWIVYTRSQPPHGPGQIVKIRPGSSGTAEILWSAAAVGSQRAPHAWSPTGDWILTQGGGLFLLSPDGKTERKLTARQFAGGVIGFSKDGRQVLGVYHNTTGQDAEWQLYSIEVATGAEKLLAGVDLPGTTATIAGFSLHPDGTRFATSIGKFPYDIWMLEGFDKP